MLTPQRWSLVIGVALGMVALVGIGQILVTGEGGLAWVIVGLAAVSSMAALAVWTVQRRQGDAHGTGTDGLDTRPGTCPIDDDRTDAPGF